MLKRKQIKAIQKFIYIIFKKLSQLLVKGSRKLFFWLARLLLFNKNRRTRGYAYAKSGFVLPTVTLLLLVVALVIAAILFRTTSRTTQVMGAREEQVIYNAATPAIERAKAKLEYLFLKDTRLPSGAPSDALLMSLLLNNQNQYYPTLLTADDILNPDPYTFKDELQAGGRLDINGDNKPDTAWVYQTDIDGDDNGDGSKLETVVYGIFLKRRNDAGTVTIEGSNEAEKAPALVTRNGPLNTVDVSDSACAIVPVDESGAWYPVGSAILRKTFQVDAIVISNKQGTSRTVATLEFQQDRQLDRGNKWGAWFRYDLEIYPGANFNWNGAMYSAGNIFVGASQFRAYLVSDDDSCFYTKDASEIMVSQDNPSGYQGQVLIGRVGPNDSQSGYQGYFDLQKPDNSPQENVQLTKTTDSAKDTKTPFDISLDPVALFTKDESKARGGDVTNRDARDGSWENQVFVQQGRIINKSEVPPYVDDTYRADNRYGPKPKYDKIDSNLWLDDSTKKNGKPIPSTETKLIDNTINTVTDRDFRNLGLDGYWERRAWADGMRVIVGPRLDLGNTFGWGRDLNRDGDYADSGESADALYPVNINPISHEQQQRRTWRDNLAAVQATAIYHKGSGNANFPIAFMATTVHPGTQQTDLNSRSFNRVLPADGFFSNFFTGEGTNGWEYEVVPGSTESETTFATMVNDTGSALRQALDNLAYFAGDPQGAFPPVPESSGQQVHPDTELAMWGNFSNLRRTLDQMRAGTPYANLSIADKTYLHTAAGALGMVAYNLTYGVANTASAADKRNLGDALWQRINGTSTVTQVLDTSPTTITRPTPTGTGTAARYTATALQTYRNSLSTALLNQLSDDYLRGLIKGTGAISETDIKVRLARMIHTRVQAERDRENGFFSPTIAKILSSADTPGTAPFNYAVQFTSTSTDTNYAVNDPFNPLAANNPLNAGVSVPPLKLPCNPADFGYFGVGTGSGGAPANATEERRVIALAAALCSTQPKYPSLYYIFPAINHGHSNAVADLDGNSGNDAQPTGEPYISDTYVSTTTNGTVLYQALTQTDIATGVALRPKNDNAFTGSCDNTNWCLPTGQASSRPVDDDRFITTPSGDDKRFVSFIDTAFYDGREAMTVRALNIDLDLLRRTSIGSDILLPRSGVVYAFREDAVREDAIARPSWSNTYTNAYATNPPAAAKDPALVDNGISPKPVDYIPDPDRRPYGFRLRNGKDIRRIPEVANDPANNILRRGLTFVSDNPVYIQGDFNLHSTDGTRGSQIEEFIDTQKLSANWSNFYSRSDLNPQFARSNDGQDTWRPSEILSDAITILSDNFKEGYLDLGITSDTTNTTVNPNGQYSYRSMNVPTNPSSTNNNGPQQGWVLEDGTVRQTGTSPNRDLPIKISRNGHPFFCPTSATVLSTGVCPAPQEYSNVGNNSGYQSFSKGAYSSVNPASSGVNGPGSIVNSILVSGVVPTRQGQGNGGFHNFPRFIENWNGVDAKITGSFVQLNFSTYATAPYNQNAWEPPASGSLPNPSGVNLWYYQAPNRAWGYDVGLQYAPAGPLAQRFVSSGIPRSEFYRDLRVNDPYICRLRRGLNARFSNRDTAALTECP